MNPFAALHLPADPRLTDQDVRAAWRALAAATHTDRSDGGNAAAYTADQQAYAQLRTPWGRSEALADLAVMPHVPAPPAPGQRRRPALLAFAAQQPAPDATLIDELPHAAANLTSAPEHIKNMLYSAFDIQAVYRQHIKQATIWATITSDTPGIVSSLLTDPRTDNDTFGNLPLAAIARTTIHHPCPAPRTARRRMRQGPGTRREWRFPIKRVAPPALVGRC